MSNTAPDLTQPVTTKAKKLKADGTPVAVSKKNDFGVSEKNPFNTYAPRIMEQMIRPDIAAAIASFGVAGPKSVKQITDAYNTATGAGVSVNTVRSWLRTLGYSIAVRAVLTLDPSKQAPAASADPEAANFQFDRPPSMGNG